MPGYARGALGALLTLAAVLAGLGTAPGRAAAADEYVKYYTVTSGYGGKPENLTEIATRFLGSGARSVEIYNLNTGRKQGDGRVLTDPGRLRPGWKLIMPWDAVGGGIQYGTLVERPRPRSTPRGSGSTSKPKKGGTARPPADGQAVPAPGLAPSLRPGAAPSAPAAAGSGCASTAGSSSRTDWARLRVAADQAWKHSRGKGQLVAVVDSGVNAGVPQLAGHVAVGLDVVDGTSRGDTDCLGTGTTMAGLIVAQQVKGTGPVGVAPEATVMPVRVVTTAPAAAPEVQVRAIEGAVAAGATVVAVGGYVDGSDPRVAKAVAAAIARNVVVVLGAPAKSAPVHAEAAIGEGALRVGGVGVDDRPAAEYRSGAVDVVAPGVNVAGLSGTGGGTVNGTGTHYAVAIVAAQAALVRSAYPDLTAQQVSRRIKATADKIGDGKAPDPRYGYGFVNPLASVTKTLAEEDQAPPPPAATEPADAATDGAAADTDLASQQGRSSSRTTVLIVTAGLMIAAGLWLALRIRRLLRGGDDDYDDEEPADRPLIDPRLEEPAPALSGGPGGPGGGEPWGDDQPHWTDGPR